jgi:6-pyruvoyl-tetrahydropterin synthase-like protein
LTTAGGDARPARLQAAASAVLVVAAFVFTLWQLHPRLLLADTTPTGGDLAAHVWGPAYLRDHLLPDLQLSGWSFDWFGGFPAYRFYMVVPALLVVIVDTVVPYGVALKLVTVFGALMLPVAAWALGRLGGARFPVPPLMAVAALAFLFDETFTIYGGNLASTLAGEFSFSIALSLGVLYLGLLAAGVRTGRHLVTTAIVFAGAALCHGIVALALLTVGTAVVVAIYAAGRWRQGTAHAAVAVGLGTLLSACWVVPFVLDRRQLTDLGYPRRPSGPDDSYWQMLFPQPAWIDRLLVLACLAGLVGSIVRRRRLGIALAALTVVFGAWAVVQPSGLLWNARLLPFLYLSRYLLVAVGVVDLGAVAAAMLTRFSGRRPPRITNVAAAIGAGVAVVLLLLLQLQELPGGRTTHGVALEDGVVRASSTYRWGPISYSSGGDERPGFVDDWAAWDFAGLEGAPRYEEYAALAAAMDRLGHTRGCGRALWEDHPNLEEYGSAHALALLPYFTDGCIATMDGLFVESSPLTGHIALATAALSAYSADPITDLPYRHADLDAGVDQARQLGVRYYLAYTPEMTDPADRHPELTKLAISGPWHVYEIDGGAELVVPLAPETGVTVTDVSTGDESISFRVDRTGIPVLVKTPYFPGWRASGAGEPRIAGPGLMAITPTERQVEVRFERRLVDHVSSALTGLGVLAAVVLAVRRRRLRALLAGRAVEQLAEDVEVAEVAGGLLDEVDVGEPEVERAVRRVGGGLVELPTGDRLPRSFARLRVQGDDVVERFIDRGVPLPVDVVVPRRRRPRLGHLQAGELVGEPAVLDDGEVLEQAGDRRA